MWLVVSQMGVSPAQSLSRLQPPMHVSLDGSQMGREVEHWLFVVHSTH